MTTAQRYAYRFAKGERVELPDGKFAQIMYNVRQGAYKGQVKLRLEEKLAADARSSASEYCFPELLKPANGAARRAKVSS